MNIIKSKKIGVLHRVFQHKKRHFFVVTGVCCFSLSKGNLLNETDPQAQYHSLMNGNVFDLAMPKAASEFLVIGNARSNQPVESMVVSARLGSIDKSLWVRGNQHRFPRMAGLMDKLSSVEPFTEMPLDYSRAYGGKNYKANPLGKGIDKDVNRNSIAQENILLFDPVKNKPHSRRLVASLGPVGLDWEEKIAAAGTYDDKWLKNDFPGFPDDLQMQFFNRSASDQQCSEPFLAGTLFSLKGFSDTSPEIKGRLPGIRVCSYIYRDQNQALESVDLEFDTVWFFPDEDLGVVVARGTVEVEDSEGLDIKHLMLAYENDHDVARPLSYYESVLKLRTDKESALKHVLNEAQLSPEVGREATEERMRQRKIYRDSSDKEWQEKQSYMENAIKSDFPDVCFDANKSDDSQQNMTEVEKCHSLYEIETLLPTPDEIASGDLDLTPIIDYSQSMFYAALKDAKNIEEVAKKHIQSVVDYQSNDKENLDDLRKRVETKMKQVDKHALQSILGYGDINEAVQKGGIPFSLDYNKSHSEEEVREKNNTWNHLANLFCSQEPKNERDAYHQEAVNYIRKLIENGCCLSFRDFSHLKLNGFDFSGMDLSGCNFAGADLNNCRFDRCVINFTNFSGANISDASFCFSEGKQCKFDKSVGARVNFKSSQLDSFSAIDAEFNHSSWESCIFNNSQFLKCKLDSSKFVKAELSNVNFIGCHGESINLYKVKMIGGNICQSQFIGMDLREAKVCQMAWVGCVCPKSRFDYGHWEKCTILTGCKMEFSNFTGSRWTQCGLRGLSFSNCLFNNAVLANSDLSKSQFAESNLRKVCMTRSLLHASSFKGCDLVEAELYQARLKKTKFHHCDLQKVNMWGAELTEANFECCKMNDAIIQQQVGFQVWNQEQENV